ncbi:MAG: NAD(P)-dependent oxidoreductase [Rhizobium sp.]|nr:NAD(P)-dependent oxidoreductase [Rhizobium sp.]
MAVNLINTGHSVTVWNRDGKKAVALRDLGAHVATTPREAALHADFVLTVLTDDLATRAVWTDPASGALNGLKAGATAIECSTTTPVWALELGRLVNAKGAQFLDAPMSGSRPQAEGRQLVFMVGGPLACFDAARPLLECMAAKVMHVGPQGSGALLKLSINALFAAQLASIAEVLGFLSRNGFTVTRAAELIGQFPIVAPPIAGAARMMAAGDNAPLFTIDLMSKDLAYLLETATTSLAAVPSAEMTLAAFQMAQKQGLGGANITAMAALYT